MKTHRFSLRGVAYALVAAGSIGLCGANAYAASEADLNQESTLALDQLYRSNPAAESIAKRAHAILVFPNITKAGLVFGGAYGEGEMLKGNNVSGYFNTVSASWGLQAGAQSYGYAVFLMNDRAVNYINKTKGLEIGVGPSVVIVDAGVAKNLSTSTLKSDAYAFIFDQQGLMASLSIEGTKISHIER